MNNGAAHAKTVPRWRKFLLNDKKEHLFVRRKRKENQNESPLIMKSGSRSWASFSVGLPSKAGLFNNSLTLVVVFATMVGNSAA